MEDEQAAIGPITFFHICFQRRFVWKRDVWRWNCCDIFVCSCRRLL